jgi:hypothetical protein
MQQGKAIWPSARHQGNGGPRGWADRDPSQLASAQLLSQVEELQGLHAKLAMALLRYTDIVPADRGFWEAGLACRDNGQEK